jgi:hypothetical protein
MSAKAGLRRHVPVPLRDTFGEAAVAADQAATAAMAAVALAIEAAVAATVAHSTRRAIVIDSSAWIASTANLG